MRSLFAILKRLNLCNGLCSKILVSINRKFSVKKRDMGVPRLN